MARILVVDDQPDERDILCLILREQGGYEVEAAEGGEAALACIARGGIDVLVTDYMMPGIDGMQLLEKALAADPSLEGRSLLISGGMYGRESALSLAAGTEVISKPFRVQEILQKIAELLAKPRAPKG